MSNNQYIFLGGTMNGSKWRDEIKDKLEISYYDPTVNSWDKSNALDEVDKRNKAKINTYVITPKMKGCYSIAEMIDDSNKRPKSTIICILKEYEGITFGEHEWESLEATKEIAKSNGVLVVDTLDEVIKFINNFGKVNYSEGIYSAYYNQTNKEIRYDKT